MIELLILACVVVAVLATVVVLQSRAFNSEREQWRDERRFLVDRAIARHVGEVVALEREDTRKNGDVTTTEPERAPRHLMEGLS